MVSSAISADLGRQELIQGSSEALATVTGIVDGTGSIGAAVGQVREHVLADSHGRGRSCAVDCCTENPRFSALGGT